MSVVEAFTPVSTTASLFERPSPRQRKDVAEQLADYIKSEDIVRDRRTDLPPASKAYPQGVATGIGAGLLLGLPKAGIVSQHPDSSISPLGALAISAGMGAVGGGLITGVRRRLADQQLDDAKKTRKAVDPAIKALARVVKPEAKAYANARKDDWLGGEIGGITGGLIGAGLGGMSKDPTTNTFMYGTGLGLAGAALGYLLGKYRRDNKRKDLLQAIVNHYGR